jgi:hypothetical protein
VHSTELLDPTPWLRGGELLLTTGISLTSDERQREYVARLARHGIAGIGLGVGFEHAALPAALLTAAGEHALPVFEVPYEVPFIAITERAFAHLISEQYDALRRSTAIQERLERLVLEERGLAAVMRMVAEALGGAACVLGVHGRPARRAAHGGRRRRHRPSAARRVRARPPRHRPRSRPGTGVARRPGRRRRVRRLRTADPAAGGDRRRARAHARADRARHRTPARR